MSVAQRWSLVAFAALLVVAGCGGGENGSGPEPVGPAAQVSVSAGNAQQGVVGQPLLAPLAVKATDSSGRAVANATVQFAILSGGGHVDPASVETNRNGIAVAQWTLGLSATATHRVLVRLLDSLGTLVDTAIFRATPQADAPASLAIAAVPPPRVPTGSVAQDTLKVRVLDQYGNAVPNAAVTWTVLSGDATLRAGTSTTDAFGIAWMAPTYGPTPSAIQVRATVGGLPAVTFSYQSALMASRFASLAGTAFGIARTPGGDLVTSIIYANLFERVSMSTPNQAHPTTTVGATPTVVAADANFAYLANMDGPGLTIVSLASNTVAANVNIPGGGHSLALSPRGDRVYVTNSNANVYVVDFASRIVVDTIPVPAGPWGIAFRNTATDSLMYVSSRNGGSISEVDTKTGNVLRAFNVGGRPHGLAISPDGARLYVADNAGDRVRLVSTADGSIIDDVLLNGAFGIAISPDGATVYVTTDDNRIAVINTATRTITKNYGASCEARQIVTGADGSNAFAACGSEIDVVAR